MSGGERVWIDEALTRAIAVYLAQSAGRRYQTLFSDEADGPLDPERKRMFMAMKREVLRLGGYEQELFISQTPELWELADCVIDVGRLAAGMRRHADDEIPGKPEAFHRAHFDVGQLVDEGASAIEGKDRDDPADQRQRPMQRHGREQRRIAQNRRTQHVRPVNLRIWHVEVARQVRRRLQHRGVVFDWRGLALRLGNIGRAIEGRLFSHKSLRVLASAMR